MDDNNVNENSNQPITIKIGLVDLILIIMAILSGSLALLYFILN